MVAAESQMIAKGYHGTSLTAAKSILEAGFRISRNPYDWLGDGVYFFQDAPTRAWDWAIAHHGNDAAVIGAEIHIVNCIDLLDVDWYPVITNSYNSFLKILKDSGRSLPEQSEGAHRLDREVFNYTADVLGARGQKIACVRAAFAEGRAVYADSAIFDRSHVQIAVREPATCVRRMWREIRPNSMR